MQWKKALFFAANLCVAAQAKSLKSALSSEPDLSILNGLLDQFDLLDSFNAAKNVTLLAPNNAAYEALAKWGFNVSEVPAPVAVALLSYHLLDGEHSTDDIPKGKTQVVHTHLTPPILTNVTSGAAVKLSRGGSGEIVTESGLSVISGTVDEDLHYDNGIIHTLNSSMVLPHNISATAALGQLTGFLDLMGKASAVYDLEELQDATLFIPTNSALEKMTPLLALLKPQQLAMVLKHHAIQGQVLYADLLDSKPGQYKAVEGGPVRVHSDKRTGQVYVNDARLVREDLIIYGGVAHIIDELLIPKGGLAGADGEQAHEIENNGVDSDVLRLQIPL